MLPKEIPTNLIRSKLIEFIRIELNRGVNTVVLQGQVGTRAKIDAIAGLFPVMSGIIIPTFGIITDEPNDPPFSYLPRIATLSIPETYKEPSVANKKVRDYFTRQCSLNLLPTVAVLFARARDGMGNVTQEQVTQLYMIGGIDPPEALKMLQDIALAYRVQTN